MNTLHFIRYTAVAAAVASALLAAPPSFAQTPPPTDTPPVVVIEDRALRERIDQRDVVLEAALDVKDAAGTTFLTLPEGTTIRRERLETRFATATGPIRVRTDLRDVVIPTGGTTVTNRATGEVITLPEGTVIRVKLDQRTANGVTVRDRIDFRAVLPDGTRVRFRDRAPEIDVNDVENEVGDNHRQRGRDSAKAEDNRSSSGRADRSDRRGGDDRADRSDRSGRGDRVDRAERQERSGRAERPERSGRGGNSGPG